MNAIFYNSDTIMFSNFKIMAVLLHSVRNFQTSCPGRKGCSSLLDLKKFLKHGWQETGQMFSIIMNSIFLDIDKTCSWRFFNVDGIKLELGSKNF